MADTNFIEADFFDAPNADRNLGAVVRSIIFEGWNSDAVKQFMHDVRATVRTYDPGATVVEKGDNADGMYLIIGGSVELPNLEATLRAPSSFGEAAVLPYTRCKERNATVVAETLSPEGIAVVTELAYLPGSEIMAMKAQNNPALHGFYGGLVKEGHQRLAEMNLARKGLTETIADLRKQSTREYK
jgi:hypothetical protein